MVKLWLLTFFTLWNTVFLVQNYDVKELRNLLNEGNQDKKAAEMLFQKIGNYEGDEALLLGYQASAFALRAKHGTNPLKKLKSVKTSSRIFTKAFAKDGNNLELRFMRYAVEVNTPRSLKLSPHVEEDQGILLEALHRYPKSDFTPETARIARDFMRQFCSCPENEKEFLQNLKVD